MGVLMIVRFSRVRMALFSAFAAVAMGVPASASPSVTTAPPVGAAAAVTGGYQAVSPARLLDTRTTGVTVDGQSQGGGPVVGGTAKTVKVTGRGGVPASGVAAVVLNVTAVRPTTSSFVTVYTAGEARPNTSNLNIVVGDVSPNLVVVKIVANGSVSLYLSGGKSDLLADVAGYYPTGGSIVPLSPGRLLDTRTGGATVDGQAQGQGPIGAGLSRDVQITGRYGIPTSGADAVILNVTGVRPTTGTFATVWPTGATRPNASNLNLTAGEVKPNLVVAKLGAGGKISIYNAVGKLDVLADVAGYVPSGTSYSALAPARLLDTRPTGATVDGQGQRSGPVGAGGTVDVQVTGRAGVPAGVTAVVLNVTGVAPTAATFVTAFPAGEARPNASNLNLRKGEVRPNLVFAKVGAGGKVSLFNASGSVNLLADVAGYFAGSTSTGPTITTASVANGTVGVAYNQTLTATGGSKPYAWTVTGGSLPAGLTLGETTGAITGTPTTAGQPSFTVQVKDTAARTATAGYSIRIDLPGSGTISGTVTDAGGTHHALGNVGVTLQSSRRGIFRSTTTDATGHYAFDGLRASTDYHVCFEGAAATGGSSDATGYVTACHAQNTRTGEPGDIPVPASTTVTINRALLTGAAISGTVTDDTAAHAALAGVRVSASPLDDAWQSVRSVQTTAGGTYVIKGLRAGSFRVCFSANGVAGPGTTGYVDECWNNVPDFAAGTPVVVTTGTKTGINAALAVAGAISGTVTDALGAPIGGIGVSVSGESFDFVVTATNGTWKASGLRAGTDYRVCFTDSGNSTGGAGAATGYLDECWNNQPSGSAGTPVSVTAGTTHTNVNAQLAAGGRVTGTVTNGAAAPVQGVFVYVSGSGSGFSGSAVTASNGTYSVRSLPAGTDYQVCFDAQSAAGAPATGYAPECWNDKVPGTTPTPVTVTAGGTAANVNATLAAGGQVTGTVRNAGGTTPVLGGVRVSVSSNTTDVFLSATTASNGTYAVRGLPTGTDYRVCFDGSNGFGGANDVLGYVDQCWNNQSSGTATPVSVTGGATTPGINASLVTAGAVSGTVTQAGTGALLAGVRVTVRSNTTFANESAVTNVDGKYTVNVLPAAANYTVCFSQGYGATGGTNDLRGYADQCWNNQPPQGTPTPVAVATGGTTTGINAALAAAGAITGTVTDPVAAPVGNVYVSVRSGTTTLSSVRTRPDGTYFIGGVPAGTTWKVCFDASFATGGAGSTLGYVDECWNNQPTQATATPVTVTAAVTTPGISASLAVAGGISGTVTTATGGTPLADVDVRVQSSATGTFQFASTAANGTWSATGLPAGTDYTVCFSGADATGGTSTTGYVDQCWNNKPTSATADKVAVTLGSMRSGVNAALASAGGISGKVTAEVGGAALAGIDVRIESTSKSSFDFATTAADGTWSVKGLTPATDYTVCFDSATVGSVDYLGECWNNQPSDATATKVVVTGGAVAANVNGTLARAGGISGKVTAAAGGAALAGIDVSIQSASKSTFDSATTAADGTWSVGALAPATDYVVCFTGGVVGSVTYFDECWNNQPDETTATKVVVTAGAVTPNINGTLASAGGISGKVTAATGGAALAGIDVSIQSASQGSFDSATTAADGTWSVGGLKPATDYVVCFTGGVVGTVTYFDECWNNQPNETTATKVTVTAGTVAPNINGTLASAGAMSGTVTADGGGALGDVEVSVSSASLGSFDSATTAADGTWSVPGLVPAADYVVCFDGSFASGGPGVNGYAFECWDNKADQTTATKVTVTSGTTRTGVNAGLAANP